MWREQLKDRYLLQATPAQLRTRLVVIWGTEDRVFDASGLEAIRALQPAALIRELSGTGYLPHDGGA
jgi:abhydrolase domain-containing protein 6